MMKGVWRIFKKMTLHILSLMSHYSKCMVIKVHFSHLVCVSGVAFLRLTVTLIDWNCNCVGLLHHPFGFSLFWNFCDITLQLLKLLLNYFVWLRITDEVSSVVMPHLLYKCSMETYLNSVSWSKENGRYHSTASPKAFEI